MERTFNLDDETEVAAFVKEFGTMRGRKLANRLGIRGVGATAKANSLADYVNHKAAAIQYRKDGHIASARLQEGICDQIYLFMHHEVKTW